ncbi:MAG: hypothetical protein AB1651_03230 [Pseudomonadota bacterium]
MSRVAASLPLLLALAVLGACSSDDLRTPAGVRAAAAAASCADAFDPAKLAAGQDCRPRAGTYCEAGDGLGVLQREPIPCDGVFVMQRSADAADLHSDYLVLGADSGEYEAILVALHYLQANAGTFVNVTRLTEIAKARKALIVVPQAPSVFTSVVDLGVGGNLLSRWPTGSLEPIDAYVALVKAVVADARSAFNLPGVPAYAAGLSNGATMAYHLACRAPEQFSAILVVAGGLGAEILDNCQPARPVGTVVVHGTADLLAPYAGLPLLSASIPGIHSRFETLNGCSGSESTAAMPVRANDTMVVDFRYRTSCTSGRRSYLVTVASGGHNWPGGPASDSLLATLGLFGPHTMNFDATVQGYDLLRLAAGP